MSAFGDDGRDARASAASEAALEARVRSRRNLMIGEWAAGLMGLEDVKAYARAVARSDADSPLDEDIVRKVSRDLADSGLTVSVGEVRTRMEDFLAMARSQIGSDQI
ncbi:MAG TPA: DUF1476 domain-containing protein [Caulobacteraceae bacterium]|jgi:hypothetical protein|nr:DUF1476 domain-containing protein [Caulobacteraceae bacterium]